MLPLATGEPRTYPCRNAGASAPAWFRFDRPTPAWTLAPTGAASHFGALCHQPTTVRAGDGHRRLNRPKSCYPFLLIDLGEERRE